MADPGFRCTREEYREALNLMAAKGWISGGYIRDQRGTITWTPKGLRMALSLKFPALEFSDAESRMFVVIAGVCRDLDRGPEPGAEGSLPPDPPGRI